MWSNDLRDLQLINKQTVAMNFKAKKTPLSECFNG